MRWRCGRCTDRCCTLHGTALRRRSRHGPAAAPGWLLRKVERVPDIGLSPLLKRTVIGNKGAQRATRTLAGIFGRFWPTSALYDRTAPTARSQRRRSGTGSGGSSTRWAGRGCGCSSTSFIIEGLGVALRGVGMCGLYVCGD